MNTYWFHPTINKSGWKRIKARTGKNQAGKKYLGGGFCKGRGTGNQKGNRGFQARDGNIQGKGRELEKEPGTEVWEEISKRSEEEKESVEGCWPPREKGRRRRPDQNPHTGSTKKTGRLWGCSRARPSSRGDQGRGRSHGRRMDAESR